MGSECGQDWPKLRLLLGIENAGGPGGGIRPIEADLRRMRAELRTAPGRTLACRSTHRSEAARPLFARYEAKQSLLVTCLAGNGSLPFYVIPAPT
jgi:hypothetical protein